MTPQTALVELLQRLEASRGQDVFIGSEELREWPTDIVAKLKSVRLLVRARPANRLICPGCEKQCSKIVDVFPAEGALLSRAYIHCDEPEDMGRIAVELTELEQWRIRADVRPLDIARALGVPLSAAKVGAPLSRQSARDAAIRAKFADIERSGKRNYVKEIQRTVPGAESLSARRIRTIAKGR